MNTRSRADAVPRKVYAEVASDVDMDEEELKKEKPAKANKATKKNKKIKITYVGPAAAVPDATAVQNEATATPAAPTRPISAPILKPSPFLSVPFDFLAEVAMYLQPKDIVSIARTCKTFSQQLISPAASTVWERAARVSNLSAEGVSPMYLIMFLYNTKCTVCGRGVWQDPDPILVLRRCNECKQKILINVNKIKAELGKIHPRTMECLVITRNGPGNGRSRFVLREEVISISQRLFELEQEGQENGPSSTSSTRVTRLRAKTEPETKKVEKKIPSAGDSPSALEEFVKGRREVVNKCEKRGEMIMKSFSDLQQNRFQDRTDIRSETHATIVRELRSGVCDWKPEEIEWYDSHCKTHLTIYNPVPTRLPSVDPSAWERAKSIIASEIAADKRTKRRRIGENLVSSRRDSFLRVIRLCYNKFCKDSPYDRMLFPTLNQFIALPSVRRLWHVDGERLLQEQERAKQAGIETSITWTNEYFDANKPLREFVEFFIFEENFHVIDFEIAELIEKTRQNVIRRIVRVTTGKILSPDEEHDYSDAQYDGKFFNKLTSMAIVSARWKPLPYPEFLVHGNGDNVWKSIEQRNVAVMTAIVKAAGLNLETVTLQELDDLGSRFVWDGHSRRKRSRWGHGFVSRGATWTWTELLGDIAYEYYGRPRAQPKDLDKIRLLPATEASADKGKGKATPSNIPAAQPYFDYSDYDSDSEIDAMYGFY